MNIKTTARVAAVAASALVAVACATPEVAPPAATTAPVAPGETVTTPGEVVEGGNTLQTISIGWSQPMTSMNTTENSTHNSNILFLLNGPGFRYFDDELNTVENTDMGTYRVVEEIPAEGDMPRRQRIEYCLADGIMWNDGTRLDAADLLVTWLASNDRFDTVTPEFDEEGNPMEIEGDEVWFNWASDNMTSVNEFPIISNDGLCLTYTANFTSDWFFQFDAPTVAAHALARRAGIGGDDAEAAKQAFVTAIGGPENYRAQDGTEVPTVEVDWNSAIGPLTTFVEPDKAAVAAIARSYNNDFAFTTLPSDPNLYLSFGPYQIAEIVENQFIRLERNPYFNWGGSVFSRPEPDEIIVRWNADSMAQAMALQNGEVDLINPDISIDVLQTLQGMPGVEAVTTEDALYEHVTLSRVAGGVFDPAYWGGNEDTARAVRLAFLDLLPRQQIVDVVIAPTAPGAAVRDSFTQIPGSAGYDMVTATNGVGALNTLDVDHARQLMLDAGVTEDQFPLDVRFLLGGQVRRADQLALIEAAYANSGLFNIVPMIEPTAWGQMLRGTSITTPDGASWGVLGDADAALFAWQSTSTALNNPLSNFSTGGVNNVGGFSIPRVDELVEAIRAEADPEAAMAMVPELERLLAEEGYGLPIFQWPGLVAWRDNIAGVHRSPLAPGMFNQFWDWTAAAAQ